MYTSEAAASKKDITEKGREIRKAQIKKRESRKNASKYDMSFIFNKTFFHIRFGYLEFFVCNLRDWVTKNIYTMSIITYSFGSFFQSWKKNNNQIDAFTNWMQELQKSETANKQIQSLHFKKLQSRK